MTDNNCRDYVCFGGCQQQRNCGYEHNGNPKPPEFFIARIISIEQDKRCKTWIQDYRKPTTTSVFWLEKGWWHRKGAECGDEVVFQSSNEIYNDENRGRVLCILSKIHYFTRPINFPVINSAFTLDPPNTRCYDDAISIKSCNDSKCKECHIESHSGFQTADKCKKIGIHVAAPSLVKLSLNELNLYSSVPTSPFKRGLVQDDYHLAISVHFHTQSTYTTEPEISIVKVTNNLYISDDESAFKKHDMKALDSRFGDLKYLKNAYTSACNYILNWPKSWKSLLVVDEAMTSFNSIFSEFIKESKSLNGHFITTQKGGAMETVFPGKMTAPKSLYETAHKQCLGDEDIGDSFEIFSFLAASNRYHHLKTTKESLFLQHKYERDVEFSSKMDEDRLVRSTSPLRDTHHYINLQVLSHSILTKSKDQLYRKEEILGILGIRFRQANLRHAIVKTLNDKSFVVKYLRECDVGTCEIENAMLREVFDFSEGELTVFLKNISCKENDYCNKEIIVFNGTKYGELVQELCHEQKREQIRQHFKAMDNNTEKINATYCNSEGGTTIKVQVTTELQLQVSGYDEDMKNNLGLRLLRIGTDCHYCFLHMNHPELAFMSDRKDIRYMELESKIEFLKNKKTDEKLDSTTFTQVQDITWFDEYLSGGFFRTSCKASRGNLLCIRKEIRGEDGYRREDEDIMYVWNAHAIVSRNVDGKVEFAVCTLSQAVEDPKDRKKIFLKDKKKSFCVDIISAR